LATPAAATAIPVNPSTAATRATTKKIKAQRNITRLHRSAKQNHRGLRPGFYIEWLLESANMLADGAVMLLYSGKRICGGEKTDRKTLTAEA